MPTFWISKYAISQGIFTVEIEDPSDAHDNMLVIRAQGKIGHTQYYHGEGRDWHRTKDSANKKAETMRIAKITSLKKQIVKLDKMKFE